MVGRGEGVGLRTVQSDEDNGSDCDVSAEIVVGDLCMQPQLFVGED